MFCEEIKHRTWYTVFKLTATVPLNVIKSGKQKAGAQKLKELLSK